MRPRRSLVRVHRWLSIALLGWLLVISVTGAWLVQRHAIEGWLNPGRYDTTTGDVGPDEAVAEAVEAVGGKATVYAVTQPRNGRKVYVVSAGVPRDGSPDDVESTLIYVDPGSGAVNDIAHSDEGFTWWLYRGHMHLWQDHGLFNAFHPDLGWCRRNATGAEPGGLRGIVCDVVPDGDDMVAWFAVGWIVVLTTGFYLWYWPGVRRWATAFAIRRGRGAFATNMSVHKVVGLVVWVPLVVIAFTGAAFAFPKLEAWYRTATPATADFELWTFPDDLTSSEQRATADVIGLDGARAAIQRQLPDTAVDSLSPSSEDVPYYTAWVTRGFSPWTRENGGGNALVAVDQYSGAILDIAAPGDGNVFDQAWDDWSFPLHTGDFGGPVTRVLWTLISLSPLALGTTGVAMAMIRRRKRAARQAGSAG